MDLFRAVGEGRVKALWIMATNPVDSLPDADVVEAAYTRLPVCRRLRCHRRDRYDAPRPCAAAGSRLGREGRHRHQSERCISRQRRFPAAPRRSPARLVDHLQGRPPNGISAGVRLCGPAAIFAEYARLSATGNHGSRDFDIGRHSNIEAKAYEGPGAVFSGRHRHRVKGRTVFADGGFYRPGRRAAFIPTQAEPENRTTPETPLILNTGRVRDHCIR